MATSLLRDWCQGLHVDAHRTCCHRHPRRPGEGSHRSLLQPAFLPLGTFRLWNTRAATDHKAKAALVEFVEDINPRASPGRSRAPTASGGLCVRTRPRTQES